MMYSWVWSVRYAFLILGNDRRNMTRYIHPGKGCLSPLFSTVSLICDGMRVLLFQILMCMPLNSQCLCIAVTFVILCIYLLFVWPLVFTPVLLISGQRRWCRILHWSLAQFDVALWSFCALVLLYAELLLFFTSQVFPTFNIYYTDTVKH